MSAGTKLKPVGPAPDILPHATPSPIVWPSVPTAGLPLLAGGQPLGPSGSVSFPLAAAPDDPSQPVAALKAFRQLAELWRLTMADQLALLGLRDTQKATYYRWLREIQAGARNLQLDRDQLDRIGHLLGLFDALGHLIQDPGLADAWIHQPNFHPLFQGRPPLARLLAGGMADLIAVRAHLEAARDGRS